MGFLGRKRTPMDEHERQLEARLHELTAQIAALNAQIQQEQAQPKLRSTAQPHTPPSEVRFPGMAGEPTFELVNHQRVTSPTQPDASPGPAREALGLRRYNPWSVIRRWWRQLRGTEASNPTLVRYLAAGNVQGLRPLRYEKRVARNRFLVLLALFLVVIYGLLYWSRGLL
jgi:hypothetical protein